MAINDPRLYNKNNGYTNANNIIYTNTNNIISGSAPNKNFDLYEVYASQIRYEETTKDDTIKRLEENIEFLKQEIAVLKENAKQKI